MNCLVSQDRDAVDDKVCDIFRNQKYIVSLHRAANSCYSACPCDIGKDRCYTFRFGCDVYKRYTVDDLKHLKGKADALIKSGEDVMSFVNSCDCFDDTDKLVVFLLANMRHYLGLFDAGEKAACMTSQCRFFCYRFNYCDMYWNRFSKTYDGRVLKSLYHSCSSYVVGNRKGQYNHI